jgi:hypothetical protein
MSYIYLQEQGAESSAECFSDISQYVQSKLHRIVGKSSCNGNEMGSSPGFLSGMMCEPLTVLPGEELPMLSAVVSHAKTLALQGPGMGLTGKGVDSGEKCQESLARFDPNTFSWKTHQCLLFGGGQELLENLPQWGSTVDGELYQHQMPPFLTQGNECGSFPTPRMSGYKNRKWWVRKEYRGNLEEQPMISGYEHLSGKPINPEWLEWLMGWVLGWADLKPLAMDRFRQWRHSHGIS